ncbi:hypothetical protein Deia_00217 [Candidatus Deianiraea vastatrix]|uniref:Protein CR006 P-loop domain-containing protein n=1 Tax=Candidatus Deianiraea vastatrix TaxID=2163644 RepID=A0A5B8XDS7_9RICK|nr:hypothetical protein Deia_00217 [Candidatus Deianiraea vastatrix]
MITHIKVKKHTDDNIALLNVDNNFKKFNLIYGYNGSGKTTFSRFFECLNEGKNLSSEKYTDCSINNSNVFDNYKNKIFVYNSDYIEKVLLEKHEKFKDVFSFDSEEIKNKIRKRDNIAKAIRDSKTKCDNNIKDLETKIKDVVKTKFDDKLTKKASEIKGQYNIGGKFFNFTIRDIENKIKDLKNYQLLSH